MFRAVSLVLISAILLCSCQFNNSDIVQKTATPEVTLVTTQTSNPYRYIGSFEHENTSEKPDLNWAGGVDEFWVLRIAYTPKDASGYYKTNIYDTNGNLLKTIHEDHCLSGRYSKDDVMKCDYNNYDTENSLTYGHKRVFSFKTGSFLTDYIDCYDSSNLVVCSKHYAICKDDGNFDIYSNAGKLLETISETQIIKYFEDHAVNCMIYYAEFDGDYEPVIRHHKDYILSYYIREKYESEYYKTYGDYKNIGEKIGLKEDEKIKEFNDYFAIVEIARNKNEKSYKLYCFYLNDYIDIYNRFEYNMNMPKDIQVPYKIAHNYVIIEHRKSNDYFSDDYNKGTFAVIDTRGKTRCTIDDPGRYDYWGGGFFYNIINGGYIDVFAEDMIWLKRGNYMGIADLDGNWILKVITEDDI